MTILEFLRQLHDDCLRLLTRIDFDRRHALHFALLALYGTLIEVTGCILTLMDNRVRLGVPPIFRTFLETYVDFHNLVRDARYGYYMDAKDASEWLKVLKAAATDKNPYLAAIAKLPDLPALIEKNRAELAALKEMGFEPLGIRAKFMRADMLEEYESFYNFLCAEAHSGKSALISRHAEIRDGDYQLVVYKNGPDNEYGQYLDSAAGLLVSATQSIHQKFETDAVQEVATFRDQLEAIRAKYESEA